MNERMLRNEAASCSAHASVAGRRPTLKRTGSPGGGNPDLNKVAAISGLSGVCEPAAAKRDHFGQVQHAAQRAATTALAAVLASCVALTAVADELPDAPAAPPLGDCADCVGEVNGYLNACALGSFSCVSTQNDDADHFAAPWSYDGPRSEAVEQLIQVATGGFYDPGLRRDPISGAVGISRLDTAKFIMQSTLNVVAGKPPPQRPQRRLLEVFKGFDGVLQDMHVTPDGSLYVRVTFGTPGPSSGGGSSGSRGSSSQGELDTVDAEFVFPPDDAIVDVRAASRAPPAAGAAGLQLSFDRGVVLDRNTSRQLLERLRSALRWEQAPVISDFDPKFNNERPLWFERFLGPIVRGDAGAGDADFSQ